jgi:hypothetical protein
VRRMGSEVGVKGISESVFGLGWGGRDDVIMS